jgi:peroxiredoxin, OsmC subfamily
MIVRKGSASWRGDLKNGKGTVSTGSGALADQPYGFNTRFEDKQGTNPEELIGAAHAGCFSMALALNITEEGFVAEHIDTVAEVKLEKSADGFSITEVQLKVSAAVPGMDKETFERLAAKTKEGCPVSKVLNAKINLATEFNT